MSLANSHVLYISYNGMLDALGQSQVIPYLKALSARGVSFTLLSYEREQAFTGAGMGRCAALRRELAQANIDWHWLRYHQKPSLPATAYDVAAGVRQAGRLMREKRIDMVHARSHIPATIALRMKRRFGVKMIFDVRGLMADEYVDAAHWQKNSLAYRITKRAERQALAAADGIVTLTERIWPTLKMWIGDVNQPAHEVIPCCADLEKFSFSHEHRARRRKEMGLEGRLVIVYSGSVGGWYLTEEMADFFAALRKQNPTAFFLWLTLSQSERVKKLMELRGIKNEDYAIISVPSPEVPSYLSASDVGLAFIKPCFSKLASSPTKFAEYLACGLPLITNAGIGDSDSLINDEDVGALVQDFNEGEYVTAARAIEKFLADPEQTRQKACAVAERLFDVRRVGVERYARLYETVLARKPAAEQRQN
ncbi:MAG: glycosyltransferase family 4 protein [Pyrinomonadaceae bacterium]